MTTKHFPKYDTRVGSDGFYNAVGAFDEGFYPYAGYASERVYNAEGGTDTPAITAAQKILADTLIKIAPLEKLLSDTQKYYDLVVKQLAEANLILQQQQSQYDQINGGWHPKKKKEKGKEVARWKYTVNDLTSKKQNASNFITDTKKSLDKIIGVGGELASAKKNLTDAINAAKAAVESSPAFITQKQKDAATAALEKIKSDADSATQRTLAEQSGKTKRYMLIGGIVVVVGLIGLLVAKKLKQS